MKPPQVLHCGQLLIYKKKHNSYVDNYYWKLKLFLYNI